MSLLMEAVVIGLLVADMFLRTEVEATGPEKVTSAPTGAVATGPLVGGMFPRTEAEGTGVLATKRGVAADYPSWGNESISDDDDVPPSPFFSGF